MRRRRSPPRAFVGEIVDGVVLAKVLDLRPHPDADKIQLVDVDRGDGEALQVCCGAFNMAVGDLIPFARIGTVMTNGMEIAQREMRGQMSNGMCCAADEIGLVSTDDGIYILNDILYYIFNYTLNYTNNHNGYANNSSRCHNHRTTTS